MGCLIVCRTGNILSQYQTASISFGLTIRCRSCYRHFTGGRRTVSCRSGNGCRSLRDSVHGPQTCRIPYFLRAICRSKRRRCRRQDKSIVIDPCHARIRRSPCDLTCHLLQCIQTILIRLGTHCRCVTYIHGAYGIAL